MISNVKLPFLALTLLIAQVATAPAAGLQILSVPSPVEDAPPLKGLVWYPCASPPGPVELRGVSLSGTPDCPVEGAALPLVVMSHGAYGWFGGHHDTASSLADAGFVVASTTHPDIGRTWQTNRPAEVSKLIDHMLGSWSGRGHIDTTRIGFFGFSRGGYTGLVLIGGEPSFRKLLMHCLVSWSDPMCKPDRRTSSREDPRKIEGFRQDTRIGAAVIAAPVGIIFSGGRLKDVKVPVQLWRAEEDELLLHPNHAEVIYEELPVKPDYHRVPQAGHFAFMALCDQVQIDEAPQICNDPEGFDRARFHTDFNSKVAKFFQEALAGR